MTSLVVEGAGLEDRVRKELAAGQTPAEIVVRYRGAGVATDSLRATIARVVDLDARGVHALHGHAAAPTGRRRAQFVAGIALFVAGIAFGAWSSYVTPLQEMVVTGWHLVSAGLLVMAAGFLRASRKETSERRDH